MSTSSSRNDPTDLVGTFGDHVKELRNRFMLVAGLFVFLSIVAYSLREPLVNIVLGPIGHQKLVYLTPAGGFSFIFSITMYAAAVVTVPFLLFHVFRFVKPSLPAAAKQYSFRVLIASLVLMSLGVAFGYFVAVPSALQFLTTFAGEFVQSNLTADSYLNFFMAYVAGLAILFQLPLLLLFWNWISPIKPGGLLSSQRWVIAGAFIVAAMITPTPDVMNQALVAGPIIGLYQLGVIVVFMSNRKKAKKSARHQPQVRKERTYAPVVKETPRPRPAPVVSHAVAPKPVIRPVAATPVVQKPVLATPHKTMSDMRPARSMAHRRVSAPERSLPKAAARQLSVTPARVARPAQRFGIDGFVPS